MPVNYRTRGGRLESATNSMDRERHDARHGPQTLSARAAPSKMPYPGDALRSHLWEHTS
jgi:hypothetical protein